MMVLMPPRCDTLLINATLLTLDRSFTIHRSGAVAIAGDSIAAVGPGAETYAAADTIDCGGRVVMPGLVNAHTHVPMTLLRGLADDLRLDVWLMGYMMPVEREFVSPDFVRLGTRLGCAEMIRSGVTCFADMYYFEEAIAEATAEAGMRALCGQTVLRFPTPDATSYEDSLARADIRSSCRRRRRTRPTRARPTSFGRARSSPRNSTYRSTSTCRKRRSKWRRRGAYTACPSCRG